jgi:6-pyruvoyl-tetrahydropterin synthase
LNLFTQQQYMSLDFKIMDNIMDQIPEEISNKLVAEGIVKRAHLPSTENMDRWDMVKEDCGLNEGELCELMNILFPVGK